jgi:hypothetical protein
MLFTTALPTLPAAPRRPAPADFSRRPPPADWPFAPPLTERQRDEALNAIARAHGRALARRFSGAPLTGFGELA